MLGKAGARALSSEPLADRDYLVRATTMGACKGNGEQRGRSNRWRRDNKRKQGWEVKVDIEMDHIDAGDEDEER